MQNYLQQQEIQRLLKAAIECSFYISPKDPGLTYQELIEFGNAISLQAGEINDAIPHVTTQYFGRANARLLPKKDAMPLWHIFIHREEPEYRSVEAFDFMYAQFAASARANGAAHAKLDHSLIVERAISEGISETDIEATLAICLFTEQFVKKDGVVQAANIHAQFGSPSQLLNQPNSISHTASRPERAKAYRVVKDIVARRTDGRPPSAEPFEAFTHELTNLGYVKLRLWWMQIVAELKLADIQNSAISITVLSAALVEGALALVVLHARSLNLGVMGSKTFEGSPTTWRLDDLVSSASAGREAAILDSQTRLRADGLIKSRQRIHAGRMLSDYPGGPPDLKPEEAREAKAIAEQVVRRVIEWLQKYPASPAAR